MKTRLIAALAAFVLAASCSTAEDPAVDTGPTAAGKQLSGSATVFAAASLTESFQEIGELFSEENPSAEIVFNFGASSGLATQIAEQGGADVFASADQANMKKMTDQELIEGEPRVFVRNRLQIIVAPGNPKGIRSLADLAAPDLKVVLAAPEVPVGRYGSQALDKAGVTVNPVSQAVDVKGVVGPVTLGEADAGIVYASDVKAAGAKAEGVSIPEESNVTAEYPIALVKGAPNAQVGSAFIDLVLSDEGQEILTRNGFVAP
ncbi:MAG TPA: molybdate ABC transporter substrate-binding protein [Actinomycetota bacterium]|nr:molybdate ABC transporter substrate-binding protein [Actinomycetota bacterium]